MTMYPIILTYLENKDFSYVEAYQKELGYFYYVYDYIHTMDSYLYDNFIPLLEDAKTLAYYACKVEESQWALNSHMTSLIDLKAKFSESSDLGSTPDMPYSINIFEDFNNAKKMSNDWISLRDHDIKVKDPKYKASINKSRPYNYKRIR